MELANKYIKEASLKKNKRKYCRLVRLACKRHLSDLRKSKKKSYPYRFDAERAQLFIDMCPHLKHWQGEWSGKNFILEPWQRAVAAIIFGWVRKDNRRRRFQTVYIEVPRKNGKSFWCGAFCVYLLMFDGESGAQVYTAATKTDQAKIVFNDTRHMVMANSRLSRKLDIQKKSIVYRSSVLKFLSADPKTQDGLNIHGCVCDELHQWRGRELWDVIHTATGARRQPLITAITTAGYDKQNTICGKLHTKTERILEGTIEDDTFFGIIFTIDNEDDWKNPASWIKANPNLGVSKYKDKMLAAVQDVINDPSALNAFLRLHLNVWTQAKTLWMLPDKWAACSGTINKESLYGRLCYGGLDLSDTFDVSSFNLCFPPLDNENDPVITIAKFYIPEAALHDKNNPNRGLYSQWYRQGYLTVTPGVAIDYNFIIRDIQNAIEDYDISEIAYDAWGARKIVNEIEDYAPDIMVSMRQGFGSMNAPTRELMTKILRKEINHGGNPVLAWMAANAVAVSDPAGNIKLSKKDSTGKIDGIIALVMALDRLEAAKDESASVYSDYEVAVM